ncbi:MAG: hypothetical protein IKA50_02985 [Clostridia bacterium]|nr:hypothetical protein [Clostridia bacterium]
MKKEERLHRLMGDIDDDLVADAAAKPIPLKVWLPRVTAAVAAVALTVGLAIAQPWANEKPPISNGGTTITTTPDGNGEVNGNVPDEPGVPIASAPALDQPSHVAPPRPSGGTPTTAAEWTPDIWYEQPWEEKPMWRRYPDFERFEIGNYIVYETTVDASKVGEYLQDVNLHGYDNCTQTSYDEIGKIYRIEGINDTAAVALQYPGREDYFPAMNTKYSPATLGELIEDLNLRENIRIGTVYYSYHDENGRIHDKEYAGLTVEKMCELLLSDPTLPNVADQPLDWTHKLAFRVDVPLLGITNLGVPLSEDGYIRIHLMGAEKIFRIGEDKVNAFMAYVEENCRLQKDDELIALPGDTTHPNGTTMTSPAQPPLETETTVQKPR